jgi:hypothetical protein
LDHPLVTDIGSSLFIPMAMTLGALPVSDENFDDIDMGLSAGPCREVEPSLCGDSK